MSIFSSERILQINRDRYALHLFIGEARQSTEHRHWRGQSYSSVDHCRLHRRVRNDRRVSTDHLERVL